MFYRWTSWAAPACSTKIEFTTFLTFKWKISISFKQKFYSFNRFFQFLYIKFFVHYFRNVFFILIIITKSIFIKEAWIYSNVVTYQFVFTTLWTFLFIIILHPLIAYLAKYQFLWPLWLALVLRIFVYLWFQRFILTDIL